MPSPNASSARRSVDSSLSQSIRKYIGEVAEAREEEAQRAKESIQQDYPRWINVNTIQTWVSTCNKLHGNHCQNPNPLTIGEQGQPLWVIDVEDDCIRPYDCSQRYLALSYVWGTATGELSSAQLQKTSVASLQERGALRRMRDKVSPTVDHAMAFVRLIGERYLWVDRLCIVQDDPITKLGQIQNMALIYARAYFTIVAAAARGVSDGLRGPKGITPTKTKGRKRNRLREAKFVREKRIKEFEGEEDHYSLLRNAAWNKRGWTLQELVFSRRALFFHQHTVTWECHCAVWHEKDGQANLLRKQCLVRYSDGARGFQYAPWPDLEEYARLVHDFSRRELTYKKDVRYAFAGISNVLSSSFPGGFLFGIPVAFFDAALLWRLEEQVHIRELDDAVWPWISVPSWSWMGWHGYGLDVSAWASWYDYIDISGKSGQEDVWRQLKRCRFNSGGMRTETICQWSVVTKKGPISIKNDIRRYSAYIEPANCPLPEGWQREKNNFSHSCDPATKFAYPIPLVLDEDMKSIEGATTVVKCRTRRAFFAAVALTQWSPPGRKGSGLRMLKTRSGEWAGFLSLHVSIRIPAIQTPVKDDVLELVAISKGSIVFSNDKDCDIEEYWFLRMKHSPGYLFEFYNVLWIKWIGQTAYRHGVGRVEKAIWEREATEQIELQLG